VKTNHVVRSTACAEQRACPYCVLIVEKRRIRADRTIIKEGN